MPRRKDSDCLQSTSLQYGCNNRVGTWYFIYAPDGTGSSSDADTITTFSVPGSSTAGALPNAYGIGCMTGDFLRVRSTLGKSFDMTYYPFEAHDLTIVLTSQLPSESVTLSLLSETPSPHSDAVPNSWTLESQFNCVNGTESHTDDGRGGQTFIWSHVTCTVRVSKVDTSWFYNDLFLFYMIVLTNYFTCLGWAARPLSVITGGPVDQRELPIEMEARSGKTAALALAYIFAITHKPYDAPVNTFAGSMPITTRIYFAGLAALAISALWSSVLSVMAVGAVRDRVRFSSCWATLVLQVDTNKVAAHGASKAEDWEEPALLFRKRMSKADAIVISSVHVFTLLFATIILIDGATSYKGSGAG